MHHVVRRRRLVVVGALVATTAWVAGVMAAPTRRPVQRVSSSNVKRLGEAFRAYDRSDLPAAQRLLRQLGDRSLKNRDYVLWLRGMVALRTGNAGAAKRSFDALAKETDSRFRAQVPWRLADVAWVRGDREAAAAQYQRLIRAANAGDVGDVGTATYRIAEVTQTAAAFREFAIAFASHPLAQSAEQKMIALGGAPFSSLDRIQRAQRLTAAKMWDQAVAELALVSSPDSDQLAVERDYWLGTTLFKMRRRYADAGKLLLGVYPKLGKAGAEAMFHGARALSRADRDDEAISWYHRVVAAFPRSAYAEEAQFLAGWLEFNRGRYQAAIAPLEGVLTKYPRSRWVDDALWFLGLSHYLLEQWDQANVRLARLQKFGGALQGGKASYWLARIAERRGDAAAAIVGYKSIVGAYPFSWYALLSRSRLLARGVIVGPFGDGQAAKRIPALDAAVDKKLASERLIAKVDELVAAGLGHEAGWELARREKQLLAQYGRAKAIALLLDRYRKAGNFNRPWRLAVSYAGDALDTPPQGAAKAWWEHAYPRAYSTLVEKYQDSGNNPEGYLYAIMRKESGFNPHVLSYANAQGLLQMIPATASRVAEAIGLPYDSGLLYDAEYNVRTGSWYIGRLLAKFNQQIPLGAGSFNSGPRPVMKWLDKNGNREIDELVELVPYTQTREYMKKVTENYARYRYLYGGVVYEQPMKVDKNYVTDELTY